MKHEIDLQKYQLRTDLVVEIIDDNIAKEVYEENGLKITEVYVDEQLKSKINKKVGNYITIEFVDVSDHHNLELVKKVFSEQLKKMLKKLNIDEQASCLIIGLGNESSTPDALGPLAINKLLVTNHIYMVSDLEDGFRRVSALAPGVMGETGIETSQIIETLVKCVKPDFLIVIDALASASIERLNKNIQMTDTGIHPGSGVGNKRKEISQDTLNIPVISIGVPTVVDAVSIVADTLNYMYKHYAYALKNIDNPINKLLLPNSVNILKKDVQLDINIKKQVFGLIGNLEDEELKQLIFEVLTPIGYNLIVTPKEVDFMIDNLSDIIGNGINMALHKNVNNL